MHYSSQRWLLDAVVVHTPLPPHTRIICSSCSSNCTSKKDNQFHCQCTCSTPKIKVKYIKCIKKTKSSNNNNEREIHYFFVINRIERSRRAKSWVKLSIGIDRFDFSGDILASLTLELVSERFGSEYIGNHQKVAQNLMNENDEIYWWIYLERGRVK